MEYQITILLLLLNCCQVCHLSEVCTTQNPSTNSSVGAYYKHGNFVKSRSAYYSNSCATFNYRLLLAGDVHSNPGPTQIPYPHLDKLEHDKINSNSTNISYSRHQLLDLNKKYKLSAPVWTTIGDLGIRKRPRGRKSGRSKQGRNKIQICDLNYNSTSELPCNPQSLEPQAIPVLSGHRTKRSDGNGGINSTNLVKIKCTGKQCLDIHYWNAQSVSKKTTTIFDYILDKDVDILVITETWLGEDDPVITGECTPSGYCFFNFPRPGDKHGGIAIISKANLNLSISHVCVDTVTFEHASMTDNSKTFHLPAIYRPPPSKVNGFTYNQFIEEFDDFLSVLSTLPGKPLIMGDINIHVNKPSKPDVARYLLSLAEHDMKQYSNKPTHKCGNILDHLICRPEDNILSSQASCVVTPFRYGSDHNMIQSKINRLKPLPERRVFTSRSYKDLDMAAFTSDLGEATQCVLSMEDPNDQVTLYNNSIHEQTLS